MSKGLEKKYEEYCEDLGEEDSKQENDNYEQLDYNYNENDNYYDDPYA